jgi:hypothetical protein
VYACRIQTDYISVMRSSRGSVPFCRDRVPAFYVKGMPQLKLQHHPAPLKSGKA